jgi:hypothetical protein
MFSLEAMYFKQGLLLARPESEKKVDIFYIFIFFHFGAKGFMMP